MKAKFIEVDLVLEAPLRLDPIVDELSDELMLLHDGQRRGLHFVVLESVLGPSSLDGAVARICGLLESLSPDSQALLSSCVNQLFDLGFESGNEAPVFETALTAATLQRLSALGMHIQVTIYPTDIDSSAGSPTSPSDLDDQS